MAGQQPSSRKKLQPQKPGRILKKRKTVVTYNRRDHKLTDHQVSWARSLAISLSGWRARQQFYKDHSESHIQAEALAKATEAEIKPCTSAQCAALQIKETERDVKSQAEALEEHARKAATWARKALLMHRAGTGKKIVEAWDLVEDTYVRNIELEKLLAARTAMYHESDSEDNEDNVDVENSENGGLADNVTPHTPSPSRSQPAPIMHTSPAPVVDWRAKARNGIIKKKLSITKGWSALTWNQKSNMQERLLLLEDDGIAINGLQDRKVSSEEVTALILERAAAILQQPDTMAGTPTQELEAAQSQSEGPKGFSPVWLDSRLRQTTLSPALSATSSPENRPSLGVQPRTETSTAPSHWPRTVSASEPAAAPVIDDSTQPFSFNEQYWPQASSRLKRKRDHDGGSKKLEDSPTSSFHASKKRRIRHVTEDGLRLQAVQEICQKVLRRVFRLTRSLCRNSSPPSRVVFCAEMLSSDYCDNITSMSTLDYLYAEKPRNEAANQHLGMSSGGFENIMRELRFLTNTRNANIDFSIYDPDYEGETTYDPVSSEDHVKQNKCRMQRQKSCVTVSKDQQGRVEFRGNTAILAELLKVLRKGKLLHRVDWQWDGLRLDSSDDLSWSLSPETQSSLMEVECRLRRCAEKGGMEIVVSRIESGVKKRL